MGLNLSWLAAHGISQDEFLVRAKLRPTEQLDDANEGRFSFAAFPNEWTILVANDFDYASSQRLAEVSRGCRVVGCQIHEGILASIAHCYDDTRLAWEMVHDSSEGEHHLATRGSLTPELSHIRDALFAKQKAPQQGKMRVDYVFDIPVDCAAALCGYWHDRWQYDWGRPIFYLALPM